MRRWLAGRTLRGRLIAGLVTLLALACAGVGIATYVVLSHTLLGQLDFQLQAAGGRYAACMEQSGDHDDPHRPPGTPKLDCNHAPGLGPGTFGARLDDHAVTNWGVIGGSAPLSAADKAKLAALPPDGRFYTRDLGSLHGDYRLTAIRGRDDDVLITGLLGTGLVRWSLRPLRRVAATATRVTQLPLASGEVELSDRVPDTNPRTEVGQVGLAFNRMLGHVAGALARRAASEARLRRFAADASHELRTPLAAIRGYAELALRHPGPVPDDIGHALSRVEAESARMSVLVDELLLLAQLDAGRPLAREPVDVTRLAIDVTSDARAATPGHRWLLELPDEPVMVPGDEHRLHQVLANLLSNAAKHTPPGSTVTTRLTTASADGAGTVTLEVTDDGPGIPPGLLPTLFERFVRGDSARTHTTTGATSTGLGLAIVHAVTTAHHGTVTVTSRPGQTRFTITLPQLAGAPAEPDPATHGS
jgi:two-component system OmpR family sensor kinase